MCATRPADWRWRRAGEQLERGDPIKRDRDQDSMIVIKQFRRSIERADTERKQAAIENKYPALYAAWEIYTFEEDFHTRSAIEAYILAREPFDIVARKLAIPREVVVEYEKYFFNVGDHLDAPAYISNQVLGRPVQTGLAERHFDLLWKMYGYNAGPKIVDTLITRFNNPSRPETPEDVSAFWGNDVREMLRMKAAIAIRTTALNFQTSPEILNLFFRMEEGDRESGSGGGGGASESILENVNRMLDGLPWHRRRHGMGEITGDEIAQIEDTGVVLRASELALYSGIGVPQEAKDLILSAQYPEAITHDSQQTDQAE
jgi:hypothetical protein